MRKGVAEVIGISGGKRNGFTLFFSKYLIKIAYIIEYVKYRIASAEKNPFVKDYSLPSELVGGITAEKLKTEFFQTFRSKLENDVGTVWKLGVLCPVCKGHRLLSCSQGVPAPDWM